METGYNNEVLPYIPAEIIDIIAAYTSSFKVDETLYPVFVFKNRLKLACLNRQQLALFESYYTDERVHHMLCEMTAIGKLHYGVKFTKHFVDIAFINTRYYEMIKKIVITLDSDREPDVHSFLYQIVVNPDAFAIRGKGGGDASSSRKSNLNSIKQTEREGDHSLGIDLYFALIRLRKYGDRERLRVKLVDRYSTAKYNELFVYFDDLHHTPIPENVCVENGRDVDLRSLWPLLAGRRTLCDGQQVYAIENYPTDMFTRFRDAEKYDHGTGPMYRIICENATKIGKNEEVVRHFESKLALYHVFIHKKKKIEKERRNQLRLAEERRTQERRDAELKRDLLEKELMQVQRITRERDLYYHMPVLVPNDKLALEPVSDEIIIMPTANDMIILIRKLARLKRDGIVSYYGFDQTGKLAIVLTNDIYTKEVLSFLDG